MKIIDLPFTVVDVETTGADANNNRIIEIGAVKIAGGKIVDTFQSLINPERKIPFFITWMTGISNRMVKKSPKFFEAAEDFRNFLGESVFVAHNVSFDFEFIKWEMAKASLPSLPNIPLCTIKLARRIFPGFTHYNLRDLSRNLGITHDRCHRALDDCLATAKILLLIFEKLKLTNCDTVEGLERIYQSSPQECRELFSKFAYA